MAGSVDLGVDYYAEMVYLSADGSTHLPGVDHITFLIVSPTF